VDSPQPHQRSRIYGLRKSGRKAGFLAQGIVLRATDAAQRENSGVLERERFTQPPTHFISVNARHADIQKHQVRPELLRQPQRFRSVCCLLYVVAGPCEENGKGFACIAVIVYYESTSSSWSRVRPPMRMMLLPPCSAFAPSESGVHVAFLTRRGRPVQRALTLVNAGNVPHSSAFSS
jgi:hypothetical protein